MDHAPYADLIASLLLEVGAVKVSAEKPFTLTSGKLSPVYFDCRTLVSDVAAMNAIAATFQWLLSHVGMGVDIVAGGESAGIPFADRLAAMMGKPLVYVRKQARSHGTGSQIEGRIVPGAAVVLVEDLITDGGSKIAFIEGIRRAGMHVEHCLVVLDREQGGSEVLAGVGIELHSLATAKHVLEYADRNSILPRDEVASALAYLEAPEKWMPPSSNQARL